MSDAPELVLLTATYPFGNKSETFLDAEMEVLAERFSRILVLPSHRDEGRRPLPSNAELVEMPWLEAPSSGARRGALLSRDAAGVAARTLRTPGNLGPYAGAARTYLDVLARNVLKARQLRRLVAERGLGGALFYDYWFENSTLALALLRREGTVRTAVCRAHGFDVYDERWGGRPVPFREAKADGLDLVAPVSEFGARYMRARLPEHGPRIRTFRLGVRDPGDVNPPGGPVPLVLSCASLIPTKRVASIPGVLARLDRPLRWVHFGSGPEATGVRAAAEALPDRVSWELRGHVDNAEVLRFYREQRVDAMISLSVSEGLPVSMMEAIGFGVPVVAVGVHGVPEIVNDTTGVLLEPGGGEEEAAEGLARALAPGAFPREAIRAYFRSHYDARTNHHRFVDALIDLREDPAPGR